MSRIFLAGLAGAVVYYVWGMACWMALPIHTPTIRAIPNEAAATELLTGQSLETGVYTAPFATPEEMADANSPFFTKHRQGPIYSIYYQAEGMEPMGPGTLAAGFVIDLFAALIASCMLYSAAGGCCCQGYWARVGFISGFGVFVALIGHVSYMNWMYFPLDYTIGFVIDVVVGWFLAGLAIAAIVKPANKPEREG